MVAHLFQVDPDRVYGAASSSIYPSGLRDVCLLVECWGSQKPANHAGLSLWLRQVSQGFASCHHFTRCETSLYPWRPSLPATTTVLRHQFLSWEQFCCTRRRWVVSINIPSTEMCLIGSTRVRKSVICKSPSLLHARVLFLFCQAGRQP